MKILVYKGKYDVYFDATVSEAAAFLALFNHIDGLGYYDKEWPLVEKARSGDTLAAHDLLRARRNYVYEGWSIETVIEPGSSRVSVQTERE